MSEYVQIQIVKCQLSEQMAVIELLAVAATKVCVLSASQTKWLHITITTNVINIWTMSMVDIGEFW